MKIRAALLTVFSIALFLSCDGSESWTDKRSEELSKVYRDESLLMTFNDQEVFHKAVEFQTNDLSKANLAIRYLIPGESPLDIKEVTLNQINQSTDSYSFVTSSLNSNREINITGSIGDKMNMDIHFKVTSPLSGTWSPTPTTLNEAPLKLKITPGSGSQTINMYGIMDNQEIPLVGGFDELIKIVGSSIFGFVIQASLDLPDSGDLIAHWKMILGMPSQSEEGMVRYNMVEDRVFVAVAIDNLIAANPETTRANTSNVEIIISLLQRIYQGIPLPITFSENDEKLQVIIAKDMMEPYLDALIEVLGPAIAEIDLGAIGPILGITKENLSMFIPELIRVIKESDEFEIQLHLKRSQAKQMESSPTISLSQLANLVNEIKSQPIK